MCVTRRTHTCARADTVLFPGLLSARPAIAYETCTHVTLLHFCLQRTFLDVALRPRP